MRTIERSTAFKRDFKRERRGRYRDEIKAITTEIIHRLVLDESLDPKFRDHDLVGNYRGYRECHVRPDLLLIYKKVGNDVLRLARMGSHSELFK